ncbi:hypothetical protein BMW22_15870 [Rhizobium leguminosarum]|uniref:Uncharacterized protein n=1 Tax=Rhizobium leguminosarum TaxID=384 RepID=A0A1L3ZBF7_RHILE|nr:hypothetical protein [Rhizobium leguminosarum]API52901.1 hypothetical protein BMW22_15870 [Rhizobium leguminosarum]
MIDPLVTYRQHLAARYLSEALLIKYATEATCGTARLHTDISVAEEFAKVAASLGYTVSKVEMEDASS